MRNSLAFRKESSEYSLDFIQNALSFKGLILLKLSFNLEKYDKVKLFLILKTILINNLIIKIKNI